jgi:hypothetical protein
MNVDEASQPAAVSGKRALRMFWQVPRVLSGCVGIVARRHRGASAGVVNPAAPAAAKLPARLINWQELDLPGAQLAETDLKGVAFFSAKSSSSDLRGADLLASNCSKGNLAEFRFRGAQLQGANFAGWIFGSPGV